MSNSYLLSDKFSAAPLPEICTPRHALVDLFQREAGKRVIYVSAPAGYGKTVSTLLWLQRSGRIPIWMGLDSYDNTLSIFYKLFCTGVLSVQPENKAMADILGSAAFSSSPVEHTIRLLSEFIPNNKQYAVVLDDMHIIDNEEIRKSGLFVQKRLPASFVTVVLTRNEIAEKYIAVTGKERCTVITAQDLAFSEDEIRKHFNEYGRFITLEEAAAIHSATNGWAIGVNALAMSGQLEIGKNSGQVLGRYIKTQLWDKWDKDLQIFILKTSVVDEMNTELCVRLTGCENAREILEDLCAKNAFISRISDDTYQYHHLFLDFLRNTMEQSNEISDKKLYKTAADYYLEKQKYFPARQFAVKSGDPETIVKANYVIYGTGKSNSVAESVNFYKSFLKGQLLESVCEQHPYIYSQYAWYYFLIGDASKMEYHIDKLYEHFPLIVQNYPQFVENAILIAVLDHRISLSQQIERFYSLPVVSNLNSQLQVTTLSMQLPYAHRTLRDYSELADKEVMEKIPNTFGRLLKTQYNVIFLELHSGFLYERNILNEALKTALQTRSGVGDQTLDEAVFCSFTHLASIYFAMGEERLLANVLKQTEQYIEENSAHHFQQNFTAFKAKLLLLDGDKTAARAWLDNYFVTETEQLELYKIFQHFTTARAYMVVEQTDKAMRYILKLKKLGTEFLRPLDIAEAGVLQAILEWGLGYKKEAADTLVSVLVSMQEYGFVRVIADEGASVLPILKKLVLNIKRNTNKSALNIHFLNTVTIAAYEQSKRHHGTAVNIHNQKPVKLSKQQKLIVTLLSKGYKNAEIAELTGLTIHTVKSHCAAAYAKLGVNSAIDAVLKARELGIIE